MGTGCARGFLAAFDTVWMVKSFAQGKAPLDLLSERCERAPSPLQLSNEKYFLVKKKNPNALCFFLL